MKQINNYIQSPLNYTGGKYKLLNQLISLFPKNIDTFIDLFGGGGNVCANVDANTIVYNELDTNVFNIVKGIYESDDNIITIIENIIQQYNLSKTNKEGYLKLRNDWNNSKNKDWIRLYTLIIHSFNNQIRFNLKGGYNMPFGKDRSDFNPKLKEKFIKFRELIKSKNFYFYNKSFEELTKSSKVTNKYFFYADSPYLITTATYNEKNGWNEDMERLLYSEMDRINAKGCKFALSNVVEHKGESNYILKAWMKKYNVHYLNYNYKNCNYHGKNTDKQTIEVLITNY